MAEAAAFSRSIDLGVKTMRGRCSSEWTCHRNRWKNDAGVDGMATVMLSSAHICRKRSTRADEWSGPCPSWPCGSSMTREDRCPHFCSPEEMNSSMIVCAPLTKSPNWASHRTRASGRATE